MPESLAAGVLSRSKISSHGRIGRRLASLLAGTVATLWGTAYVAAKYALSTLPPFTAATARFALAMAMLWPVLLAMQRVERLDRRDLPLLVAASLFQATFYFALQYVGLQYTTASNTALIVNTRPIFVAVLSTLLLREALGTRRAMGILVAFIGVAVVVLSGSGGSPGFARQGIIGDVLILLNALSGALAIILLKKVMDRYSPLTAAVYTTTIGTIGLIPLAAWETMRRGWPAGSALSWAAVVYMALANTAVPYLLWYRALSVLKTSETAVFLYLTPVVSVILSALLLGERIGIGFMVGAALVLCGAYQTVIPARRQRSLAPVPSSGDVQTGLTRHPCDQTEGS